MDGAVPVDECQRVTEHQEVEQTVQHRTPKRPYTRDDWNRTWIGWIHKADRLARNAGRRLSNRTYWHPGTALNVVENDRRYSSWNLRHGRAEFVASLPEIANNDRYHRWINQVWAGEAD